MYNELEKTLEVPAACGRPVPAPSGVACGRAPLGAKLPSGGLPAGGRLPSGGVVMLASASLTHFCFDCCCFSCAAMLR